MKIEIDIEKIKQKTSCDDCCTSNIEIGYSYADGDITFKRNSMFGDMYEARGKTIHFVCKDCGKVLKMYMANPSKL